MISYNWAQLDAFASSFSLLRIEIYTFAFLLFLAGYFGRIWAKRREPSQHIETIGYIGILVIVAVCMEPLIKPLAVTLFVWPAEKLESANENFQMHKTLAYFAKAINPPEPATGDSFFSKLSSAVLNFSYFSLKNLTSLLALIFYKAVMLLGSLIAIPLLILQRILSIVLFAFSPIAVSCLAVPALKEKGASYLLVMFSVLTWPLGFAIVAGMANVCIALLPSGIDAGVNNSADGIVSQVLVSLLAPICGGLILIGGVVLVPSTAAYLFLYGGTVFNPISAAASAVPVVGRLFSRR